VRHLIESSWKTWVGGDQEPDRASAQGVCASLRTTDVRSCVRGRITRRWRIPATEELLSAIGAEPLEYASKTRCCGASLIITNRKAALEMVRILLKDAIDHGADVIATTCPCATSTWRCTRVRSIGNSARIIPSPSCTSRS